MRRAMTCLGVLAFVAALAVAQVSGSASSQATNERLRQIKSVILQENQFSATDQRFVLEAADSPFKSSRYVAVGLMLVAVHKKLFPGEKLLTVVRRKLLQADGIELEAWLQMTAAALGHGKPPDGKTANAWRELSAQKRANTRLEPGEKQFILSTLRRKESHNQITAAKVIVVKRGLDKKSLTWLLSNVDAQIRRSRNDTRRYWQLVRKVTVARNPVRGPRHASG